jgi:hypothetical protein
MSDHTVAALVLAVCSMLLLRVLVHQTQSVKSSTQIASTRNRLARVLANELIRAWRTN